VKDFMCDVSVVIGFKDWGLVRLEMAVRSIQASFGKLRGEIIVSDYGSADYAATRELLESLGAKYVYTETDGTWSRSRALNAGFAVSSGEVLISTDADMIFSPRSMETIASLILDDPSLCLLLQCRDLPEGWSDQEVAAAGMQWNTFEQVSRLRPRWGMGGMMAVPRGAYMRIRGLDERMHTYGGEDIDFATRAKRAGQRLMWIDDSRVRMYHMWHAPTRKEHDKSETASLAIEYNKKIVYNDKTFVRNTLLWAHRPANAHPLVTVAISTFNRANFLSDSINSVLAQTMQDFEIVVVDDGSTDDTKDVIARFNDERIRYFYQENAGIAAARNRAADEARGTYTAVHDDDDLMTPWRLEKHFEHIHAGVQGSFGSFVNFGNTSGEMKLFASKKLNPGTILETGGAPGHGTWLVETNILRKFRYDESLSSGVDNNLALRMVRSGVVMRHTGEIMMLRRMHDGQVTVSDEQVQKTSARQTRQLFSFNTAKWGSDKLAAERGSGDFVPVRHSKTLEVLTPYLPDHLVSRTVRYSGVFTALTQGKLKELINRTSLQVIEFDSADEPRRYWGILRNASLSDVLLLRETGAAVATSAVLRSLLPAQGPVDKSAEGAEMMKLALEESFAQYSRDAVESGRPVSAYTTGSENFGDMPEVFLERRRYTNGDRVDIYEFCSFSSLEHAINVQLQMEWKTMEIVGSSDLESMLAADDASKLGEKARA
jgi:glycosyltransferase involved in cell wall biosynthesis